jgi:hypothetical protein
MATYDQGGRRNQRLARRASTYNGPRDVLSASGTLPLSQKRVSFFDEQSRYVVENTGSAKRTKPIKADFIAGETPRDPTAWFQPNPDSVSSQATAIASFLNIPEVNSSPRFSASHVTEHLQTCGHASKVLA